MEDENSVTDEASEPRKRRTTWLIVALVAAIAAGVLLASTVWTNRWTGEDALGNELVEKEVRNLQDWCAAQSTYDAIRRELFRRAAQVRGGDQQAYARLSDFALLRVSGPVARGIDEQLESVTCSGTANLDLPPGVAAAGGRRSLSGDIDYMVQPAADGTGNVVRLGNADSIVVPLATLARSGAPQTAPLVPPDLENQVIEEPAADDPLAPQDEGEVSTPAAANPSFDCDRARTRGEVAVCGDPGLAALDRQMAAQYNGAIMEADRGQRRLLERTRGRFLSYRDRCATNQCVADTYRSRMREISDIMANRWRG
jgi:uncharacterized protein YecT (DUF1311 family)